MKHKTQAARFAAIAAHGTDTSDGTWDSGVASKNLPNEPAELKKAHAWVDPDGNPATKAAYRFIHHEVSADGTVGAANLTACSTGIGVLNGGRGGTTIPADDKDGVYNHLAKHLRDAGREPPEKDFNVDLEAEGADDQDEQGTTKEHAGSGATFAKKPIEQMPPVADSTGRPYTQWRMPVAVLEGVRTGDGRQIASEALSWRDLPQPLMANLTTTHGHEGAELVGRIDGAHRVDASKMIDSRTGEPYGKGAYAIELNGVFTNDEVANKVATLVRERFLRGVSVDLSDVETELEVVRDDDEDEAESRSPLEDLFFDGPMVETVTSGRIMGCTITPFPAFEGAFIELIDADGKVGPTMQPARPTAKEQKAGLVLHATFSTRECRPCVNGLPLVAGGGPQFPPMEWFQDPKLDGPTPITVMDNGRVFGHLAQWGVCHTGFSGTCVQAPHSKMDYALFRTGVVKTAEGEMVPVGQLTMDTGHASIRDSRLAAMRHYDNTGTAVADVAVGEDQHGAWVAGALRPDVSEEQIRTLRASALSGDWRDWGGSLELVAILAVNVPGFPVVRELVASGQPQALVAAGGPMRPERTVAQEVSELARYLPELRLMRTNRVETARNAVRQARAEVLRSQMATLGDGS